MGGFERAALMLIHHHLSNREPAGLLSDTGGPEPAPRQAGGADGEAGAGGFRMGDVHACGWFTLMCGKNPQLTKKVTWRWMSQRGRWPLGNLGDLASEAPNYAPGAPSQAC